MSLTTEKEVCSIREALNQALFHEMERDKNVFLIGEDIAQYEGAYKVTKGLLKSFGPERVIDSPISEYGFSGLAVGASFAGLRPVVEFMTFNFAMQAIDHIVSAAKTYYMSGGTINCPIVFRGPNGAAAGVAAQHSHNYMSLYANIPGLKVVAPYTAEDHRGLLISAIRDNNPVIFLENEVIYGNIFEVRKDIQSIEIGKANVLHEGSDVTIIASSIQVKYALEASEKLKKELSIHAEVIDLRTIRPLDFDTIFSSVKKTNRVVIIEEGWALSGIGGSISAEITKECFDYLDAPPYVISAKDVPLPYAQNLEKKSLPSTNEVVDAVKNVLYI